MSHVVYPTKALVASLSSSGGAASADRMLRQ
jgi:hypothetical protein